MKRLLLFLLLVFSALTPAQDELLSADKAFAFKAEVVGDEILLNWDIAKGYYLYKEKVGISANHSARLGKADFPKAKIKNDQFFGIVATYRKNLLVRVPVLPGKEKSILLTVSYQGCADIGVCYPPIKKSVTLTIKGTNKVALVDSAFKTSTTQSSAQNQAQSMFANTDEVPLPPDQAFNLSVVAIDANTLKMLWEIRPNYYLYHDKFFIDAQGADFGNINFPKGEIKDDDLFGRVEVHKNRLEVDLPLQNIKAKTINLTVRYQGCWEGGVCYPPQEKTFKIPLTEQVTKATATTATATTANTATTATTVVTTNTASELTETEQIIESIQGKNIFSLLFFFFIAGLGASFTSCVLPMIPILSAIIIGQEKQVSTKRAFAMSLTFVIFMSLAYALIGILFAKSSEGLQLQIVLQNPWVLGVFSLIFVLLALSMFGFFEIKIPNFIQNKLSSVSNKQKGGSFIGVAIMGFLSALIVGPCSAPILSAALLYIAQTVDTVGIGFGASALFALGMGMGAPLVVAGAGVSMPKPGVWMDNVKHIFGIIMLGMAIYFIQRVVADNTALILWALLLTIAPIAMGVLNQQTQDSTAWRRIFRALGLIILGYGILLWVLVAKGGGDMFAPLAGYGVSTTNTGSAHVQFTPIKSSADLDRILAKSKLDKKIVMLDFYADWCISCKELERFVFSNAQVLAKMQNVVAIQADVTENDAVDRALMKRFNIIGPPAILFFNNGIEKRSQRIVGEISAQDFIQRLNKI